jgi:hypothetical protein
VAEFSLPRLARQLRALMLLAVGLLLVAGCGLNDYETKMIQEHEMLLYQDEQARTLEAPLKVSDRSEKDKDGKEFVTVRSKDVFIRPPKGIRIDPEKKGPQQYGTLLQQYLPAPRANAGPFKEMTVAAGTKAMEDFRKDVVRAYGVDKDVSPSKITVERGPGMTPLTYQQVRIEADNGLNVWVINFLQDPKVKLAIVFKVPKDDSQHSKAMKMSLASAAVGANARQLFASFKAPSTATTVAPKAPGKR